MNHIEIVQLLIEHLPYNWEHAWNELDDEAQEQVVIARKAAWKFVSEHQLDVLVRSPPLEKRKE